MKKFFTMIGTWYKRVLSSLSYVEKASRTASAFLKHAIAFEQEREGIWLDNSNQDESLQETIKDIVEVVEDVVEDTKELIEEIKD